MKLAELLAGLATVTADIEIKGLALDSRRVESGFVFIALSGSVQHGIEHAEQALANGAVAIVYDPAKGGDEGVKQLQGVIAIALPSLAAQLGQIAAKFYRDPSRSLDVIGVTGTNGKTSCSQFLAQALPDSGVIGTLGWGSWGQLQQTVNTTPDALALQRMLSELQLSGKRTVVMEVSSHGLEQGRVSAIHFNGALFTNLTRDHLDYHDSMEQYLAAKTKLFHCPGLEFAVVNLDDPYIDVILKQIDVGVKVWGFGVNADNHPVIERVWAEHVVHGPEGIRFDACWQDRKEFISTTIVGVFNLENLLAVLTVQLALGVSLKQSAARLAALKPVMGRMEHFGGDGQPSVFIDYAHSPDALDKVLAGLRPHSQKKLSVVFGCGGDRDKGKRAHMGAVAEKWADEVIVTDDNPRTEPPETIVDDILKGCLGGKVTVIHDREQAIRTMIKQAERGDCIVVAGKGHEHYQEVNGVRLPFSDQQVVRQALMEWSESP